MLEILDTGRGMDIVTASKSFEPFFTTKEVGNGLGLGLSYVYGVALQSGGHICVKSELGKGTKLRICLPALVEVVNENELTGTSNSDISTGKKIFVVEDNHTVRRMIATFLVTAGHQVQASPSAEHALEILEKTAIDFDLILTDVIMHGMTGKDLADRLKEIKPHLPVLFMSGYSDEIMVKQGSDLSEIHFIEKPFKKAELLDKISIILKS
jgi:CheY-like chemotaxis protein